MTPSELRAAPLPDVVALLRSAPSPSWGAVLPKHVLTTYPVALGGKDHTLYVWWSHNVGCARLTAHVSVMYRDEPARGRDLTPDETAVIMREVPAWGPKPEWFPTVKRAPTEARGA